MHLTNLMAAAGVVAALAAAPRAHAQPMPAPPPQAPAPQAAPPPQAPPPLPAPAPLPTPQAAPPPAPPQAAAPQQPGPWYRFSLADGRVVDGQWVGGDTQSYYVQTASGTFSIARANVVGVVPMTAQAPAPQPPPPPPAVMAPPPMPVAYAAPPPEDGGNVRRKVQGWGTFALAYGTTALIALGRRDDDPDATLGLIPIAGPILWTTTDEDKWGKDGWDWLAILSALAQLGGVAGIVQSMGDPPRRSNAMTVAPVAGRQFGGVVLGGRF